MLSGISAPEGTLADAPGRRVLHPACVAPPLRQSAHTAHFSPGAREKRTEAHALRPPLPSGWLPLAIPPVPAFPFLPYLRTLPCSQALWASVRAGLCFNLVLSSQEMELRSSSGHVLVSPVPSPALPCPYAPEQRAEKSAFAPPRAPRRAVPIGTS